jgi:hypothetical protein
MLLFVQFCVVETNTIERDSTIVVDFILLKYILEYRSTERTQQATKKYF